MKRRYIHRWAIWLLPLLLVRAFVPVGFMVSASVDGLALIVCSGAQRSQPEPMAHTANPHAGHAAAHHHEGSQQEQDATSAPCPFALIGSACAHPIPQLASSSPNDTSYAIPVDSLPYSDLGPIRADRIRGPPALS